MGVCVCAHVCTYVCMYVYIFRQFHGFFCAKDGFDASGLDDESHSHHSTVRILRGLLLSEASKCQSHSGAALFPRVSWVWSPIPAALGVGYIADFEVWCCPAVLHRFSFESWSVCRFPKKNGSPP